ncbi:Dabb family protein [Clostridium aminobutyricum]|uniref:Dabb family protein n=1 Tax=Clostridium aminobutyricum TaxID=33953 RepID=A0A939DA74_CLOAM|nr:Dabb family protein [Clostridium aminobutyricum]MBN7773603.1 Dabb family protein [Clostridium aminobutyricum]
MIVNNVLLKLKDREEDNVKKAQAVLLGMKGKIEGLLDIQVETNLRPSSSAYDLLLITKFASLEDLDGYLVHPVHLEVATYIGGVLDTQASLCYEMQ